MNYFIPGSRFPQLVADQPRAQSLQRSAQQLLNSFKIQVKGERLLPTANGTLIISNHVSAFDLFIIGSLVESPFFFFGSQLLKGLGGKWREHIMPIYLSASRARHFWDWPRKVVWHYRERVTSQSKAHEHNLILMKQATKMLKQGETVLLFPSGRSLRGNWANGVGYLLHSLKKSRVKVVLAYIPLLPWYLHIAEFMPDWILFWVPRRQVKINWSASISLHSKEIQKLEPREITTWLKRKYEETNQTQ